MGCPAFSLVGSGSTHAASTRQDRAGASRGSSGGLTNRGPRLLDQAPSFDRSSVTRLLPGVVKHPTPSLLNKGCRKGRIAPGYDADLVLVDPSAPITLSADDLRYRHRQSPFVGLTFGARPQRTILRGQTIAVDGEIVGVPTGCLLRPAAPVAG